MNEQVAVKGVNEEQTASLETALLRATKGWSSLPAAGLTCHCVF